MPITLPSERLCELLERRRLAQERWFRDKGSGAEVRVLNREIAHLLATVVDHLAGTVHVIQMALPILPECGTVAESSIL